MTHRYFVHFDFLTNMSCKPVSYESMIVYQNYNAMNARSRLSMFGMRPTESILKSAIIFFRFVSWYRRCKNVVNCRNKMR